MTSSSLINVNTDFAGSRVHRHRGAGRCQHLPPSQRPCLHASCIDHPPHQQATRRHRLFVAPCNLDIIATKTNSPFHCALAARHANTSLTSRSKRVTTGRRNSRGVLGGVEARAWRTMTFVGNHTFHTQELGTNSLLCRNHSTR